jgi:hypothetical protein
MVYSGHTLDQLKEDNETVRQVLNLIDILIDGRFEEGVSNKKIWRGSDNQRLYLLSEQAQKFRCFENAHYEGTRPLSFELNENNELKVIGIPGRGFMKKFEEKLLTKGMLIKRRNINGNG